MCIWELHHLYRGYLERLHQTIIQCSCGIHRLDTAQSPRAKPDPWFRASTANYENCFSKMRERIPANFQGWPQALEQVALNRGATLTVFHTLTSFSLNWRDPCMIPGVPDKLTENLPFAQQIPPPLSDTGVVSDLYREEAKIHSQPNKSMSLPLADWSLNKASFFLGILQGTLFSFLSINNHQRGRESK